MPADFEQPSAPPRSAPQASQGGRSWQFLAFIVLALAIAGSLPTLWRGYNVLMTGVNWEQVPFALQQRALWARNTMCATTPGERIMHGSGGDSQGLTDSDSPPNDRPAGQPGRVRTFTGMEVRVQACWNGDVLVRTVPDRDKGLGRAVWIAAEGFALEEAAWLSNRAFAQSGGPDAGYTAGNTFDVICQDWAGGAISSGRVIRVIDIRKPEGSVRTRETINILTGEVVSVEQVSSDAGCAPGEDP